MLLIWQCVIKMKYQTLLEHIEHILYHLFYEVFPDILIILSPLLTLW